jgi:hypothetical protein
MNEIGAVLKELVLVDRAYKQIRLEFSQRFRIYIKPSIQIHKEDQLLFNYELLSHLVEVARMIFLVEYGLIHLVNQPFVFFGSNFVTLNSFLEIVFEYN